MKTHANESRLLWLLCGVVGGLCLAYFWPHEELRASATDHSDKFAICTVEVAPLTPEAVFVLNFTTGEMRGALLNQQTGTFTNYWYANVAQDFQIQAKGDKTKFAIIPGQAYLGSTNQQAVGGGAVGSGVIYVAEITTGQVGCYRFHYVNTPQPVEPRRLEATASFQFYDKMK